MIGWRDYLGADFDEKPKSVGGNYFCGCVYVAGKHHCEHHGDPVEKFSSVPRAEPHEQL